MTPKACRKNTSSNLKSEIPVAGRSCIMWATGPRRHPPFRFKDTKYFFGKILGILYNVQKEADTYDTRARERRENIKLQLQLYAASLYSITPLCIQPTQVPIVSTERSTLRLLRTAPAFFFAYRRLGFMASRHLLRHTMVMPRSALFQFDETW